MFYSRNEIINFDLANKFVPAIFCLISTNLIKKYSKQKIIFLLNSSKAECLAYNMKICLVINLI